ncbi:MAG: hypothetical protein ACKPKO_11715, partial [Candidatus Fonsibacter sp.]
RGIDNQPNLVSKYVPLNATKIVDGVTKTVFEFQQCILVMIQQEISSIALRNPVASIILPHLSCLINQRRRRCQRTLEVATTVLRVAGTTPTSDLQSQTLLYQWMTIISIDL